MIFSKLTNKPSYSLLIFLSTILFADPWHPEINHRPRILLLLDEIEEVQNRLNQEPYLSLWNNQFEPSQSIYQNARRFIDLTINTQSTLDHFLISELDSKRCCICFLDE